MQMKKDSYQPDKKIVAVCGLFCPACIIFIAQRESPEKRKKIAENLHLSVEALKCDGCRAENRFTYCETCKLEPCAAEKGLDFCGECEEYPCEMLKEFQAAMPHRIELWQAQARIKPQVALMLICTMLKLSHISLIVSVKAANKFCESRNG